MARTSGNPLISTRPSDSALSVALHPLALLTISDQVTRRSARKQKEPVAGALLGQQKGGEVTAEHAFPIAKLSNQAGRWTFDEEWLDERIQQYKDVHKAPALELVGWFTVCAQDGPLLELVSLQKQITSLYNENAILLAFHPELVSSTHAVSGKLPITIYESVSEADPVKDDGSMQVDGEETWEIKFRPLPYTIETDETEMIAIDYVAKGAGSAAALVEAEPPAAPETTESTDKKGKKRADGPPEEQKQANGVEERVNPLTAEEEDQIAGITTRLNSVKMLQTRLALLSKFIHSLPPSYLSDLETALTPKSPDPSHLPHLRNIQALLTRLSLLTPAESASSPPPLVAALQAQSNDVALVSMLSLLGQDIQSLSELGRKFATVEGARSAKGKAKGGAFSGGTFAGLEERDARTAGFALSRGGGMLV